MDKRILLIWWALVGAISVGCLRSFAYRLDSTYDALHDAVPSSSARLQPGPSTRRRELSGTTTATPASMEHRKRVLLQEEESNNGHSVSEDDQGGDQTEQTRVEAELPSDGTQLPTEPKPDCYYDEHVPRLVSIQTWTSEKRRPRESITLMTQLSDDRLSMLENQCHTWNDPIVAMVYVPLFSRKAEDAPLIPTYPNTTLQHVIEGIDAFHYFMEATAPCVLTIELVGQFTDPLEPEEYPINALRNRAIKLAQTDVLFMLDVDFVPATDLGMPSPGYRDPVVYDQLIQLTSEKKALVLPAFEITNRKQELVLGQNFARNLATASKRTIRDYYLAGMVDAFNGQDAPWGHGPTNTSKWISLLDTPMTYRANYQPKYEPFLVLNKKTIPWCDERFVGYGGNKIAYINQLRGEGFSFHVHPFGFTFHVPHPKTKAADTFVKAKRAGASEMDYLRAHVERGIADGVFVPHTSFCKNKVTEGEEAVLSRPRVDEQPATLIRHDDEQWR